MALEAPNAELERRWQEYVSQAQAPEWVRRMIEDCWRTGTYRVEDLRRLLGDPTKGVEVGPYASLSSLLASRKVCTS
jgi:hypothetical protein